MVALLQVCSVVSRGPMGCPAMATESQLHTPDGIMACTLCCVQEVLRLSPGQTLALTARAATFWGQRLRIAEAQQEVAHSLQEVGLDSSDLWLHGDLPAALLSMPWVCRCRSLGWSSTGLCQGCRHVQSLVYMSLNPDECS